MTARRASASAVVLTVLAVGVMLVMIMFAARTGPQRIVHGTLRDPNIRPVDPSYTRPTPPTAPPGSDRTGLIHGNPFLHAVGFGIRLALIACFLWLVYRLARRAIEAFVHRRRPPPPPEDVEFDVLDDPAPLAEEMRQDAENQLALLLGGSPRNAIVACWDRFEEQAERVHAARKPWETSSEFTLRLLDAVSADAPAVSRLEMLYREARFSTHEIDEPRREAAVEALEAIHASLGARAVRG
jgi:Domain of unknown function (DUF4129)